MAQYRILESDELEHFEKEFIEYLVVNGITGEDWEKLKTEQTEEAERIVALFSDVVFEGVMRKVNYLDFRSEKVLKSFMCLKDRLILVAMEASDDSEVNFLNIKTPADAAQLPNGTVRVFSTEKSYSKKREEELFAMTEAGCDIADGEMFRALCMVLPAAQGS